MSGPEDLADLNEVSFSVVRVRELREPSAAPYKKGARTRLTARTFLLIIKRIEKGWPVTESCRAEGFTYRRFRQLCAKWPAYQRRYERAERQRAEHRREVAESLVLHHAKDDWCAAAWWLERCHPERFSLKTVVRHDGATEEKHYHLLTHAEMLEAIETSRRVELERPKGCLPALPDAEAAG